MATLEVRSDTWKLLDRGALLVYCAAQSNEAGRAMATQLTPDQAKQLAWNAFVYGFPMVENYRTLYETTIVVGRKLNTLYGKARLFGPSDDKIVTPNNDTAYTNTWLDLGTEPLVLHVPAVDPSRYYSFQLIDAFTNNIAYIGPRTTGNRAGNYVLAGPNWNGGTSVPNANGVIQLPSRIIFMIGRTGIDGPDDLANGQAIMDQYGLKPLSALLDSIPPTDAAPIPYPAINASTMRTLRFFDYLNFCLTWFQGPANSETDTALMAELSRIGVGPGLTFNLNALSLAVQQGLMEGIATADADIDAWTTEGQLSEGWQLPVVGVPYFGTDPAAYKFRAMIARAGIYANSPDEAVYPMANFDITGTSGPNGALTGERQYTMRFEAGQLPAFHEGGFWSLTMYDARTRLFVANDLERYSLGNRSNLVVDPDDGSVTIYIQHDQPTGDVPLENWLPAAAGPFYLVLRIYYPVNQRYAPPGIVPQSLPTTR